MTIDIIGNFDRDKLYGTGSFTKLVTTYVCLCLLAEKYDLSIILDDDGFLDKVCKNQASKEFLSIFKKAIGSEFTLRDVCSFYNGLPYTFDLSQDELESVDCGNPFKHHSIMDELTFLTRSRTLITQIDPNRCKFHYSELAIIFLGYLIEKIFDIEIESLYQRFVIETFSLKSSLFSRTRPENVFCQDLSDVYDYPSIAILDHGYFCYSNGYFTTLNDQKRLLEGLLLSPVFSYMTDISKARAASNKIMNGITVELRIVQDDIIYGYEGLSYSGCNIWAYSTKYKKGYLTIVASEEEAYDIIYGQLRYTEFDIVPDHTQQIYKNFIQNHLYNITEKTIPEEYIGNYQRVNINEKILATTFSVGSHYIIIRNPDEIKYEVLWENDIYRIKCKDAKHGARVGFYQAKSGRYYMFFDGTLYRKN
jgi:hypothetical protein